MLVITLHLIFHPIQSKILIIQIQTQFIYQYPIDKLNYNLFFILVNQNNYNLIKIFSVNQLQQSYGRKISKEHNWIYYSRDQRPRTNRTKFLEKLKSASNKLIPTLLSACCLSQLPRSSTSAKLNHFQQNQDIRITSQHELKIFTFDHLLAASEKRVYQIVTTVLIGISSITQNPLSHKLKIEQFLNGEGYSGKDSIENGRRYYAQSAREKLSRYQDSFQKGGNFLKGIIRSLVQLTTQYDA